MWRALARLAGVVILVVVALGVVFLVGMRRKSPVVQGAVRRTSRAVKPLVLRTAGQPGASASVIRHVGRTSGRSYETPISAEPVEGGFIIALPYGQAADWVRNVLAAGSAVIVDDGTTYAVDEPEIVSTTDAGNLFPADTQRTLRLFRVGECLRVRAVPA
jgi:deazaflavin-dependent oxidoreductase (nitroreductase family)